MSIILSKCLNRVRQIIKEPWYNIPSYSASTVTVTNASPVVTGAASVWTSNAKAGETFHISGGQYYTILSIDSDTQLTLTENYAGTSGGGKSYTIRGGNRTDASLVEDLNSAEQQMVNFIQEFDENYFMTHDHLSYVAGTEIYDMSSFTGGKPRKIMYIERTDLGSNNPKPIYKGLFQDRSRYLNTNTNLLNPYNVDEFWYFASTYSIGIMPIPNTAASNNLTVWYVPEAGGFTTDASTSILPDSLYDTLCYTAAILGSDDDKVMANQARLWQIMAMTIGGRQKQQSRTVRTISNTDV
jgi:hypothetical protein